ncbi:MAG: hypothetical protein ACXVBE_04135 [Bdellovibrionota bacterium]
MRVFVHAAFVIFLTCLASLLFSVTSEAYFVATLHPAIDRSKETHLIVIGYSHGMGRLLLESAIATGRRLENEFPERQIVFLTIRESPNTQSTLRNFGLFLTDDNGKKLSPVALVEEIKSFPLIASIEFFTHAHVLWGAGLEGLRPDQRINHETPGIRELRGHFIPFGYIFFHGCNAGLVLAPALAKILDVPVAGALTSTLVEQLHSDGHWYENDWGKKVRVKGWARDNSVSYSDSISCAKGACVRMRPDNHPYRGVYGNFSTGLGFYKFFCPDNKEDSCDAAMALSLLGNPSERRQTIFDTLPEFEKTAANFLCFNAGSNSEREQCVSSLTTITVLPPPMDSFHGVEPLCSVTECKVTAFCSGTCRVSGIPDQDRVQMRREYEHFRRGWQLLHGSEHSQK